MDNVAIVSKDTFKRIVKDVKDITKEPLTEQNIFYQHDESSILKGYAMIIGPKDTCYHNGFFFLNLIFLIIIHGHHQRYCTIRMMVQLGSILISIEMARCVYPYLIHGRENHGLLVKPLSLFY